MTEDIELSFVIGADYANALYDFAEKALAAGGLDNAAVIGLLSLQAAISEALPEEVEA